MNQRNKRIILIVSLILFGTFLFNWTQPALKNIGTIKIWDKNHTVLYESAGVVGKKIAVSYEDIPPAVVNALVASEDNTFWTNPGIDMPAMIRSLMINLRERQIVTGASTITQQLARIAVIAPNGLSSRSWIRKIQEILIALRLNLRYSKKDILTQYLSRSYFGNESYGIASAAETYFHKPPHDLSLAESAFLIGLLSNPTAFNPYNSLQKAEKREIQILDLMVNHNAISQHEVDDAKHDTIAIFPPTQDLKAPHAVHYVLDSLKNYSLDLTQGVSVETTIDYPTFLLSEDIARQWVSTLKDEHDLSNAAMVVLDNHTGAIISMLGGIDYFDSSHSGEVNLAVSARQPGSALKPITYATAFEQGFTPATLIFDVKKVFRTKKGEGFTPNNYDGLFHGMVLAREALASSFNLPAVEMLSRIGIKAFLSTAHAMGITTLQSEDRYDLALTLGGGEVTLLDLSNVFATFARGGIAKEPYIIASITTDTGKTIYQHHDLAGTQVLGKNGPQVAYLISNILSDPKARIPGFGEKNPLVLSHPAAVKTGTTTDWHDNWTVGYTPSYTVGVWVGNTDNHPMREVTGVMGTGPIWNQFFEEFLKGKPIEQFTTPIHIKNEVVCSLTGLLDDGICPEKQDEIFIEGTEPKQRSNIHKKIQIDTRNNLLATTDCPSMYVRDEIVVDYPPEVYSWAVANNQPILPRTYSPLCGTKASSDQNTSYIAIVYPKEKTVFENAPNLITHQAINFEVQVSSDITSVSWFVDGTLFRQSSTFPFSVSWSPILGRHTIMAKATTIEKKELSTPPINISVLDYKAGY